MLPPLKTERKLKTDAPDYHPCHTVLVILLGGGIKKRQQHDINAATANWEDYKRRKQVLRGLRSCAYAKRAFGPFLISPIRQAAITRAPAPQIAVKHGRGLVTKTRGNKFLTCTV